MPAPKIYLGSRDIAGITGVSLRSAQYMMKAMEMKGKTIAKGMTGKVQLVSVDNFVDYVCKQDGSDPKTVKANVMDYIREEKREKHDTSKRAC